MSTFAEKCMERFKVKSKRKNGFIEVVDIATSKVVKKTKTGRGAARWVACQVRGEELKKQLEIS